MSEKTEFRVEDGVGILSINNPPVNALGHGVRQGIVDALTTAEADPRVRAIVIRAEGRTFPVGADIREFGQPMQDPGLPEVCNRIEACSKPVIAALHGTALGGGFEVALGAHYRLAEKTAQIGLPEVNLGILPGAGGTQRTPRICGAEAALDLMLSGKPISAWKAEEIGLVDAVVDGDVTEAAVAFARDLDAGDRRPTRERRDGLSDARTYLAAIKARRRAFEGSPLIAPGKIVDCVEAAELFPFEAGLAFERTAFEDCLNGDQSAALRHAFLAERLAAKLPGGKDIVPREVNTVAVIGGGNMGAGIAVALLDAGLRVVMIERDRDSLSAGEQRIEAIYDRSVARGRITEDQEAERLSRLSGTLEYGDLANVDLAIEAVIEDMEVKKAVFGQLDAVLRDGAVLATNTSYLDINELAASVSRPWDVVGIHFFSPANIMKLVEVVVADATAPKVAATGFALAKRLGKIPVRAGVTDGFIGNRILTAYRTAADFMLEDGASPYEIDAAMHDFGFPLGPYQVTDLSGLDISWARRKRLASTRPPGDRYVAIGDILCEAGRLGQKTGAGYYRYEAGERRGRPDPAVLQLIAAERQRQGIAPRAFSPAEIQRRCLAAMVNEGARLLQEGIALRASDIDTVMIHGYGFPRWRGGPMKAADLAGLLALRNDLKDYARHEESFWRPAALFDELIKNGRGFESVDGSQSAFRKV